jgi:hypothetical protein
MKRVLPHQTGSDQGVVKGNGHMLPLLSDLSVDVAILRGLNSKSGVQNSTSQLKLFPVLLTYVSAVTPVGVVRDKGAILQGTSQI